MTLQEVFCLAQISLCCAWVFCLFKLNKTVCELIDSNFKNELEILTIRADIHFFEHMNKLTMQHGADIREIKEKLVKFD